MSVKVEVVRVPLQRGYNALTFAEKQVTDTYTALNQNVATLEENARAQAESNRSQAKQELDSAQSAFDNSAQAKAQAAYDHQCSEVERLNGELGVFNAVIIGPQIALAESAKLAAGTALVGAKVLSKGDYDRLRDAKKAYAALPSVDAAVASASADAKAEAAAYLAAANKYLELSKQVVAWIQNCYNQLASLTEVQQAVYANVQNNCDTNMTQAKNSLPAANANALDSYFQQSKM